MPWQWEGHYFFREAVGDLFSLQKLAGFLVCCSRIDHTKGIGDREKNVRKKYQMFSKYFNKSDKGNPHPPPPEISAKQGSFP